MLAIYANTTLSKLTRNVSAWVRRCLEKLFCIKADTDIANLVQSRTN